MNSNNSSVKLPRLQLVGLHLLGWILNAFNIMLPALFMQKKIPNFQRPLPPISDVFVIGGTHLIMQLLVFYINYFFIFDQFFWRRNKAIYFVISAIVLLGFWFAEFKLFDLDLLHMRPPVGADFPPMPPRPQPDFLLPLISAYFASFLVKLYPLFMQQQIAQISLQNQKQEIQISLLKAQMEPHFFFNTLNNLRYLLRAAPEKADNAIIQLSDLLRYTVYTSEVDKVSLSEEITYIKNYIELQKIRLPSEVGVETKFNISVSEKQIPPLLLIPFIENAFKYGVSAQYPGFIIIEVTADEKQFQMRVNNRNYRHKVPGSTGIGISNVKRRLAYYYPDNHTLEIQNTDTYFTVTLQILW